MHEDFEENKNDGISLTWGNELIHNGQEGVRTDKALGGEVVLLLLLPSVHNH